MTRDSQRVCIVGGGVAGLSAAHELAERGFAVTVFERNAIAGGKARSMRVPSGDGQPPLPGEHGFRFFPGFYQHLPDTLRRIPTRSGRTVHDSLVPVRAMMFALTQRPPLSLPTALPRSWREVKMVLAFFRGVGEMGLTIDDFIFYLIKIWRVLTSCEARRMAELEPVSWWDYVEADSRTQVFRDLLVVGVTRNLVAAKADLANARTVGQVGIQFLRDLLIPGRTADQILDGPTNQVWIDPWIAHLESMKVAFEPGWELTGIGFDAAGRRIREVTLRKGDETRTADADHFLFALPVEVMDRVLDGHPELENAAPDLAGIETLAGEVAWMNGIQFYLTAETPICPGHVNYLDSPWALTSICHSQFWPSYPAHTFGDGTVKTVLSVDISAWDGIGGNGKEAWDCPADEVAAEVWTQLKRALNHGEPILRDDMLHSARPWFIDEDITARVRKDGSQALPPDMHARRTHEKAVANRTGEPDLLTNAEPLLVNVENSWRHRPEATTSIPNLFLASDYVRTHTNLATMEAANEAARRAVNGILDAARSPAPRCWVAPFPEPFGWLRAIDEKKFAQGEAWEDPILGNAGLTIAGRLTAFTLKAIAAVFFMPKVLLLFGLLATAGFVAIGLAFDTVWSVLAGAAHAVVGGPPPPPRTAAAVSVFWFGLYAITFGLSLHLLPSAALKKLGFPRQEGPWMTVLGSMPVIIGTLYITGALFGLPAFFWAIVFGRVGVFLLCLRLGGFLVVAALPDLVGALWTAVALCPTPEAGFVLVLGLLNVIGAVAFRLFPRGARERLGFPEAAGNWLPLTSALLGFWGAYDMLAAVAGYRPLMWATALGHAIFGTAFVAAAAAHRRRMHVWRPTLVGLAYWATAVALALTLSHM